ncbi:MAG: 2-oxo acid dehydrogenase subunit E2 [Gammaproteobacteria bacterium]|nr:MAG: 2-oxo acid dehydrogenase subunit E2 [Gammaproteobacteria bacterium]
MKIFYLPDLGEGLAEAEIRQWYVKVGDEVKVDQPLVSMETAKAVVDVPSPYAGKIVELHGEVNEVIKTGAPLVSFDTGEAIADKGSVVGKLETSEKKWDEGEVIIGSAATKPSNIKAMPAARVLAKQMNVDLNAITPTGPQGLITPNDVKQFAARHASPSVVLPGETEALHGIRRTMAQAMSQSHQDIVPVTVVEDADITDLPPGSDITIRLLRAMVAAAKVEPALNAWFDGKKLERKLFDEVNIGMAVDAPEGLLVPVLKDVAMHSDEALRQQIDTYKKSARDRSIPPADMQGATILLSNFGTITGRYATPILLPPLVAILGCGRSREVVIPREGQIVIGRILPLSLTVDHRAVTGGEATRFLGAVIQHLRK